MMNICARYRIIAILIDSHIYAALYFNWNKMNSEVSVQRSSGDSPEKD